MTENERVRVLSGLNHLRAALVQVLPTDDKIIVEHMQSAVTEIEAALTEPTPQPAPAPTPQYEATGGIPKGPKGIW